MDWEKAKKIFIYILIFVNAGLFVLNYKNSRKYTITAEEEKAVYQLLSSNNIGLYTSLIEDSSPMRQMAVSALSFDIDEIKSAFFEPDEEITITVEFDSTVFKSASKTVTVSGNEIELTCPEGTGKINGFTKKSAADASDRFIKELNLDAVGSTELESISKYNNGYIAEYSQKYNDEKIFCSSREVYVTEKGVESARMVFYNSEGYTGDKKHICSCDEALLTVMFAVKNSEGGVPQGTYIEKIERGYDFQAQSDISEVSIMKLVPCYRVYVSAMDKPFIIDAYTNTVIENV